MGIEFTRPETPPTPDESGDAPTRKECPTAQATVGKIVLPGGSGYLGEHLATWLAERGNEVVILSRRPRSARKGVRYAVWDGKTLSGWVQELEGAQSVINLAGRTVNCRYNAQNRQEITDSRLHSTRVVGEAISRCKHPPSVWINSASATIYRHAEDRNMDEETGEIGKGFSVDVCLKWEQALKEAQTPHTRKVALRLAMVFGEGKDGVMAAFQSLVKRGLGGTLGSGSQYVSWVHLKDFLRGLEWIILHEELSGAVNLSSPNPLPNREFMRLFRKACRQPIGLPATRWMLEIGAFFLGTETELLLKSRRVVPKRLLDSGFEFQFPNMEAALKDLMVS